MKTIVHYLLPLALSIAGTNAATAQFRVTENLETLQKLRERLTVEDLAITERGIVAALAACSRDGALFISGRNYLLEAAPSEGLVWRVKRLQGDKVTVSVTRGTQSSVSMRTALAQSMLSAIVNDCEQLRFASAPLYQIESINGEATSAALLVATP